MKIATCLLLAAALHAPLLAAPEPARETLVGINYFAGWWKELPNKWHGHGWTAQEPDWRPQHPERVPLLGCYNDQSTMDREIVAAADHDVDFFPILWYFAPAGGKHTSDVARLNRGLTNFERSPNAPRLKFIVEYCNHADFSAVTDADWAACLQVWVVALRHPSYLRVGNRLVFKIHDAHQFWMKNGQDLAQCHARLDSLRKAVREAGLGELLIGGGIMSRTQVQPDRFIAQLFDFTATYMGIPPAAVREQEHPYTELAAEARAARSLHAADPVPWMPYLAAGWNPRPWTHPEADENHRRFFAFPTRAEWTTELRQLRDDFHRYPTLGLPLPNGGHQKIFTIYAWNEFGEGGIVAPTQADGAMKLECIKEVF
jgi:hypothetical protein